MPSLGLLPLADINYLLAYFKDGKGDIKGLLKAIGGVYSFLIDLVPDAGPNLNQFTAQSAVTDEVLVEKLEELKGFHTLGIETEVSGMPVWLIPVLLKLLDLASLFLRK